MAKNNCNKIKQTCGTTLVAQCVSYEGTTNENSPLKDDCALSISETTQDIYNQLEQISLSELGEKCLTYVLDDDGKIIVKNVLLKYEEEICTLKEKVEELESVAICETNIQDCNIDWGTLVNSCGQQPTTLAESLQLIIDTIQP